ncbi:MAG: Gfo/Idh/MocA family oxidoreductase [Candidatus Latescibacteria bacterium]|jgi:predicted dehydrogenase|nr:Gfo/Idh/MocA family oxidoreductase [Candidatus Latescibacterota bacterium]
MAETINVGMVGYSFMGKSHSNAYRQVGHFFDLPVKPVLKAICGRTASAVSEAADEMGWEGYETDWKALIARDDIGLIDVSTPGDSHKEIAIAACEAGKHVICEKPLANSLDEAREMADAAKKAGVRTMTAYNYRRVPAVALAKQMIGEGILGEIYHWRAVYLQDWIMDPDFPLVWRLQKDKAGSGPHGDLNAHITDLARHLVGEIDEVVGMDATFIKERPLEEAGSDGLSASGSAKMGQVTVDDATLFLARFENGALGSFEATRFAGGRKNHNSFEINGSKGSVVFDLERMNELQYFNCNDDERLQGFRTVICNEASQPYNEAWWPSGHIIGWEHTFTHEVKDLLEAIDSGDDVMPDFADGVKTQAVLEAVSRSAEERSWIKVSEL